MAAVRASPLALLRLDSAWPTTTTKARPLGPDRVLPKAPGPAQPLSHVASRHRKKLDAALSSAGYYDVAHGRESARVQRIQVIDLSRHPGLTALQVAALPPDRQYKYQIERAELELTVNKAMQKKFDLIMAERTVVCESIAFSNDETNPVLAKRIREDCNYTASMGIAGGYYDGPLAYQLQIKFLIPDVRSEHDKNFYENAWKVRRAHVGRNSRLMDARLDHGSGGAVRHR